MAAMRGDADEAARRMEAHIEDALERVLRLLGESSEGRV